MRTHTALCVWQDGLANLLLLGTHSVVSKSKVGGSVPAKGAKGAKAAFADKAVTAFHKKVFDVVVRHVNWEVVKCLVLAGPGSAKDDFRKYLELEMVRQNVRSGLLHCVAHARSLVLQQPTLGAEWHPAGNLE